MNSIFMVISNTRDPGNEVIFGLYPTQDLAEARVDSLMSDPDYTEGDNDFIATVVEAVVGPAGADTEIYLR